jgi:hypothetical protein
LKKAPLFYIAVAAHVKTRITQSIRKIFLCLLGGQAHVLALTAPLGLGTNSIEKVEIGRKNRP